jgi:hypothetical protein
LIKLDMLQQLLLKFILKKLLIISLIVIFIILFLQTSFAQQQNDFRAVNSGNWSDTLVWQVYDTVKSWHSTPVYPTASANVITINFNHTVALDVSLSLDQFIVGGILTLNSGNSLNIGNGSSHDLTILGTITGSGDINLSGGATMIMTQGTITGPGALNISAGSIFYNSGSTAINRTINNSGTFDWTTGSITGTGSVINNNIFINECAFAATYAIGLTNNGTYNKTTNNTNFLSGTFQNAGTINIQSGGLLINPPGSIAINGIFTLGSGGNLQFGNNSFNTFTVNANISGAGTVTGFSSNVNFSALCIYNISGTTTALSGAMNFTPGMTLTNIGNMAPAGGTINLPAGLTIGGYGSNFRATLGGVLNSNTGTSFQFQKFFTTGNVTGSDSIFVSDSIWFSSGSLSGTGPVTLKQGGVALIFNNGITLDKTFINNGTTNWTNQSISGNGNIINNSVFNMMVNANSCSPAFTNNGTLNKGSVFVSGFNGPFTNANTATLNITNSTMMPFSNNSSQSIGGIVNISSGATLQLGNTSSGTYNITANISGAGSFYGHTSNVNFLSGCIYNLSGNTGTYSGTINFTSGMTLTNIGTINSSSGTINIQSGLTSYTIGTSLTLTFGGVVNFNSGRTLTFSSINANGTIGGIDTILVFGNAAFTGGGISGSGPFNLLPGSVMDINASGFTINKILNNSGTLTWLQGSVFGSGPVNNNNVTNFSTSFTPTWSPVFNNTGTINKTTISSPFYAGGVNSTGTININSGTLLLIPNSGTFSISGTVNISSGATISFGAGSGGTATQNVSANISGAGNVTAGLPTVNFTSACIYNITGSTNVIFGSANFNAGMTLTNIGNFSCAGGTANFPPGLTIGNIGSNMTIGALGTVNFNTGKSYSFNNLDLSGTIAGTDSVFIINSLAWANGGISSSVFVLKSAASCILNTTNGVFITGKFINNGIFNWTASGISSAGTFVNNNIFNINTSGTPSFGPFIINNGTINKTTANITSIINFLTNNSIININAGVISTTTGVNNGTVNLTNNTTLSINGLFTSYGNIVVPANSFITGNSVLTYNGTSWINDGIISLNVQFDSITNLSGSGVYNNNCTFLNGCNATLSSNVQFKNVFVNSGAIFNLNGYKASLNGNSFSNAGTLNMNNSWIEYNGATAQVITTGIIYKGLIINNPAGVSIPAGTLTVDDTLKIISGFLNAGANSVSLSSTGYLVESSGATVRGTTGNITTTRMITNPNNLNVAGLGATITSTADLGNTTITRGFTAYTINGSGSVKRYYNISPANNSNLNATLTYHYDDSELNGLNEGLLSLFRSTNAGTNWATIGGAKNLEANNITYSGINSFSYWTAAVNPLTASINITAIVDALYNTSINTLNKKDTVTVYLRNSFAPYAILDSAKILPDTLTFSDVAYFNTTPSGTYYISLKYRNALETWSKSGGENYTTGTSMAYDFTVAQSQSFGNSTILKNGKYCLVSGDLNQDGFVNGNDFTAFSQQYGLTGYLRADLNGDNVVNGNDFTSFSAGYGKQSLHP